MAISWRATMMTREIELARYCGESSVLWIKVALRRCTALDARIFFMNYDLRAKYLCVT